VLEEGLERKDCTVALKILLADDSMVAQSMGKKILSDAGYEVTVVSNGAAALKEVPEVQPDIILLDVYMPGYTGLEVCQKVKSAPETARTPVLLTVGMLEPFRPEDGIRARADGVIVKPFEATDLVTLVAKIAERIPQERRQRAAETPVPPETPAATSTPDTAPLHAKGQEFSWKPEAPGEEPPRPPSPAFAAAQAMVKQAEAKAEPSAAPATVTEAAPPPATAWEAADDKFPAKYEEPEAEPHPAVLRDAEVAAGLAATALAGMHWQDVLGGGAKGQPAEPEAATPAGSVAEKPPELEPTRIAAPDAAASSAEPALISDLTGADWLRDEAPIGTQEKTPAAGAKRAGETGEDTEVVAHEEALGAALSDGGVAHEDLLEVFGAAGEKPPEVAAATLPELEPTLTAAAPPAAATMLPELERFAPVLPVAAAPETVPAEPEEDFLQIENEVPLMARPEQAAVPGQKSAAEEGALPDAAAIELAEQIVERVLERIRPELIKEVARLLS
jgi:CheY-like chemotaxis protein